MGRVLDLVAAGFGMLVAAPIVALLIVAIRFDSPGPGIFSQVRIGRHGRPFTCYKLRTMANGAPNVPTHHATSASVTRIGRVLRTTKLDELPQLWNVLAGDMSLVGPRPCLPSQTELIEERRKRGVLDLRPGITGLAQVRGIDMSDPVRLAEVDAEYANRRSLALNARILMRTVIAGRGDRVRA